VRWGYGGKLVHGPISIQGRFSRCAPMIILACLLKISPSVGRASRGTKWGGGVTSHSSLSSSSFSSSPPKDSGSEGVSSPYALAASCAALQARLLCLHTCSHSL
jgi:hypothetical protein